MKTLYVMVHPNKEIKELENDFFAQITSKGEEQLNKAIASLKENEIKIDLLVSSPSLICETTAMTLAKNLDIKKQVLYNEVLYQGYLEELIESINFTFHTVDSLFIIGHHPLVSNFIHHFCGYKDKLFEASIMKIEFNTSSWVDIEPENAQNIKIIFK